ncbi:MAG: nitroreductase family protein [Burkholderiales bacterium]|jgi:ferredoxin|nr:nitroreductase family protein [Burkholderiales bacterium]
MAIPTSRTTEAAIVTIHQEPCNGCGLCVSVCKDFAFRLENEKAVLADKTLFGCVGCGHCMAVCPKEAIEVRGRTLVPEHVFPLSAPRSGMSYEHFLDLLQSRRSIREFRDMPVERPLIEKILDAAKTAPMGIPPSDVNVLVLDSREKNNAFAQDFCAYLKKMRWLVSPWFLAVMRPFWGKETDKLFRDFVVPFFSCLTDNMDQGVNVVTYDAPLAMYFYGSPYADPADPLIAATYAMLAAETLGLGSCMVGGIHPLIQRGKKAKQFRERHGIKYASQEGLVVIFGYPAVAYHKGIQRSFASVTYA